MSALMRLAATGATALVAALISASAARAGNAPGDQANPMDILSQAVENTQAMMVGESPYKVVFIQTVEIDDGDSSEIRTIRVDTRQPQADRMELLEIDGQPASAEQKAAFLEELGDRQDESEEDSGDEDGASNRIVFSNLDTAEASMVSQAPGTMVFNVPHGTASIIPEAMADMAEHLSMQLFVDTRRADKPVIRVLRAFNEGSFKPGLIGKVKHFEMQMHLKRLSTHDLLVLDELQVSVRAKALFRKIESTQHVVYTDYEIHPPGERAGASAAGVQ